MMAGSSMKLMIRNRPPHLGQASGSAAQTLRINRAQARLQWRRKSSGSGSGAETATGVILPAAQAPARRDQLYPQHDHSPGNVGVRHQHRERPGQLPVRGESVPQRVLPDERRLASFNVLFWFIYRPGSDLYVVFNQGWNTDLPGPETMRVRNRSLAIKMTYWLSR